MRLTVLAAPVGALVLAAVPAHAQVCLGHPSFGAGLARVGVEARAGESMSSVAGGVAIGRREGLFGGGNIARVTFEGDDRSESATSFSANVGYPLRVTPSGTSSLCPLASFTYLRGPSFRADGIDVEANSRRFGGGVAVGGLVARSPTFVIVPFGSLQYFREMATIRFSDGTESLEEDVASTYGVITVGAGLVFRRALTLQPSLAVGTEDGEFSAGIALGFNFGSRGSTSSTRGQ